MKQFGANTFAALAATLVLAIIGGGCQNRATQAGRQAKQLVPLPANALLTLNTLQPPLSKPTPSATTQPHLPKQAARIADNARTIMNRGRYAKAIDMLLRADGFAPNHYRINRMLGICYTKLPDKTKALAYLSKALDLSPDDLELHCLRGELYATQKRSTDAILAFRAALGCSQATDDNSLTGRVLLNLASLLKEKEFWTASLECLDRLSANIAQYGRQYATQSSLRTMVLRPHLIYILQGELHLKLRHYEQASALFERAYRHDRSNSKVARLLVETFIATGKYKRAEQAIVQLATQEAQRSSLPKAAFALCITSGDKTMPMRIWTVLTGKKLSDSHMAVALAAAADHLGMYANSVDILATIVKQNPGDITVVAQLIQLHLKQGHRLIALELLADAIGADQGQYEFTDTQLPIIATDAPKDLARQFASTIPTAATRRRAAMHFVAGKLAAFLQDTDLASRQFQASINADNTFLPAYEALGTIYASQRKGAQLRLLAAKIGTLKAKTALLHYMQGRMHMLAGNDAQAIMAFTNSLSSTRQRRGKVLEALGDALMIAGRFRQATAAYNAAAKIPPDSTSLTRKIYESHMALRAYGDAQKLCRKMLKDNPESLLGQVMLARALLLAGQFTQADAIITKVQASDGDSFAVRLLVAEKKAIKSYPLLYKHDYDSITSELNKLIASAPRHTRARKLLAIIQLQNGQYADGAKTLEDALTYRNDSTNRNALAIAQFKARNFKRAAELLLDIAARGRRSERIDKMIFHALAQSNQPKKLIDYAKRQMSASRNMQQTRRIRLALTNACLKADLYDDGDKVYAEWIAADTKIADTLRTQHVAFLMLGKKYDKALALAKQLLAKSPSKHANRSLLVEVLLNARKFAEVHTTLDKWIDDPNISERAKGPLRRLKIRAYAQAENWDEACKYADSEIRKMKPSDKIATCFVLMERMIAERQLDRAAATASAWHAELSAMIAESTTKPATQPATTQPAISAATTKPAQQDLSWVRRAMDMCETAQIRIATKAGLHAKAAILAEDYLKTHPKNIEILIAHGNALSATGDKDKAMQAYRKAIALNPTTAGLLNNLAYSLSEQGQELQKAYSFVSLAARKLRSASTDEPLSLLDTRAWILYKQGKLNKSGKLFLHVMTRLQNDELQKHAVIFDHAGDVYYRLGWTQRARDAWQMAVEEVSSGKALSMEQQAVLLTVPKKLKALKAGTKVDVAPPGKDVTTNTRK